MSPCSNSGNGQLSLHLPFYHQIFALKITKLYALFNIQPNKPSVFNIDCSTYNAATVKKSNMDIRIQIIHRTNNTLQ